MTSYVKSTNFASKDSLATGNPLKIVKGTEIDTEFNNIATAIDTKADIVSPTLTGTPSAPTASAGTNTTQIATTAFVTSAITTYDTALTVSTSQIEDNAVTNAKMADLSVGTAELIDDSVTAAKILAGAVGTSELADAAVTTVKLLDSNVTPAKLSQPLTRGTAVASTSGTSIDFTGIPSWAKKITIMFKDVSTTGSNYLLLRLGTSSGIESTGYFADFNPGPNAGYYNTNVTTGVPLSSTNTTYPSYTYSGVVVFYSFGGNYWIADGNSKPSGYLIGKVGGTKTLSGTLDRISITTDGSTDTFDAGSINIMYE